MTTHSIYRGEIISTGGQVTVDGEPLDPRHDLMNHAPALSWGHDGPESAQLALAILAHHLDDPLQAIARHRRFQGEVIAKLPRHVGFTLAPGYVAGWMRGEALLPGETARTAKHGLAAS